MMTNPLQYLGIAMDNIARCVYRHLLGVRIPAASIRLADIKADRQFILTRLETACADVAYWRGELERTEEMIEPAQPWPRCAASAGWTTAAQAPAAPEPPTEQESELERTEEMIEPAQPWPRCAASAGWTTAAQAPAAPEPPTEQENDAFYAGVDAGKKIYCHTEER